MSIQHFKNFSITSANMKVRINFDRLNRNYDKAQFWLDSQVMTDMVPLMPLRTGNFIQRTRAMSASVAGSGEVYAAAPPFGRFQYMGVVMVDPETGFPWARPGARKVVTDRPLTYSNPDAVPFWFEETKTRRVKSWVPGVKRIIAGGG